MPIVKGHPVDFFEERNHDQLDRKSIFTIAQWDAQERAADDYPYAVYRDKASVERLAAEYLATYSDTAIYDKIGWRESWKANASEIKRLYTPAFVDAYQKNVASRDEAARLKAQPQPQPTTTPATRTVQGATATLKSVDHNPDEDL